MKGGVSMGWIKIVTVVASLIAAGAELIDREKKK